MGVVIVEVIRYAVVTHACTDSPFRSSAMVRIDVLTIVWSRAPRNMPIIRPTRIVRIWACVYSPVSLGAGGAVGRLPEVGVLIESRVYRCLRQPLDSRAHPCSPDPA